MARGKSLPVPSLGVCEPTCGSVSLLLAQPPTQEVPVPSPLHVRGSPAPVPTAAAAATGHRHRHPAGVLPAQGPRSRWGPQGCQGMSLASRGGTGPPAHTTVPPCAPCSCTAKTKSPWGPGRAGTACAQHRATAAGSLSPRRLDAGRSPQLLSHPGAGADRRGSGQTQPRWEHGLSSSIFPTFPLPCASCPGLCWQHPGLSGAEEASSCTQRDSCWQPPRPPHAAPCRVTQLRELPAQGHPQQGQRGGGEGAVAGAFRAASAGPVGAAGPSPGGRQGCAGTGVSLSFHMLQKLFPSESRGVS